MVSESSASRYIELPKVGLARKKRYFCDGTVCLKIKIPFNSLIKGVE